MIRLDGENNFLFHVAVKMGELWELCKLFGEAWPQCFVYHSFVLSGSQMGFELVKDNRNNTYSWDFDDIRLFLILRSPLTLSNPIFLSPTYSPALIYFGRERGWLITCNYPTVLKKKNINRNSTTCAICWLKSVLHEEKHREQENHNFGWQIAQFVLFLFLFFSFKNVG
jgi:hypothetical protein